MAQWHGRIADRLQSGTDGAERELAMRRMLLLHGLALSFGALPVLYMGDELAMENDSYLQRPQHAMDSRWLQRPVFDRQRWLQRHDGALRRDACISR
jgi:amylosucrase